MKLFGLIVLFVGLVIFSFMVLSPTQGDIPVEIYGRYHTSDPKYQGRHFYLSEDTVEFGVGGENSNVYTVTDIEARAQNSDPLYIVTFEDDSGNSYQQSFYFEKEGHEVITFKNQRDVRWQKADEEVE